jgi:hypothetical protein
MLQLITSQSHHYKTASDVMAENQKERWNWSQLILKSGHKWLIYCLNNVKNLYKKKIIIKINKEKKCVCGSIQVWLHVQDRKLKNYTLKICHMHRIS